MSKFSESMKEKESSVQEEEEEESPPPMETETTSGGGGGVMLYFSVDRDYEDIWYAIDPDRNSPNPNKFKYLPLRNLLEGVPKHINLSSCAAMGSVIYMSGGFDHSKKNQCGYHAHSDQVYYFDTSRPQEGWKGAPPMNSTRVWHYLFAHQGKLYAIGGSTPKHTYAEIYDPTTLCWQDVAGVQDDQGLPIYISGHAVLDPADNDDVLLGNKVLFHSSWGEPLFYLHLGYQSAGVYTETFGSCKASAYVDGIIYFLPDRRSTNLLAYDVSEPHSHPKPVMFSEWKKCLRRHIWDKPMKQVYMVPLGDRKLAFVWTQHYTHSKRGRVLRIYCSKLEMSRVSNGFRADLLSHSKYHVRRGTMRSCLAVWPSGNGVGLGRKIGENSENSNKQQQTTNKEKRKIMSDSHEALVEREGQRKLKYPPPAIPLMRPFIAKVEVGKQERVDK